MLLSSATATPFEWDFSRKTRLKAFIAISLLAIFLSTTGCMISFTAISLISMGLGLLNSMGVFGDGELSEILGYVSIIGSVVGFAGNMMSPGGGIGFENGEFFAGQPPASGPPANLLDAVQNGDQTHVTSRSGDGSHVFSDGDASWTSYDASTGEVIATEVPNDYGTWNINSSDGAPLGVGTENNGYWYQTSNGWAQGTYGDALGYHFPSGS